MSRLKGRIGDLWYINIISLFLKHIWKKNLLYIQNNVAPVNIYIITDWVA